MIAAASAPSPTVTLAEKYRPRTLSDIRGQEEATRALGLFLASPAKAAFIFEGSTGVGKTSAALALARDLGVDVENAEFGGLYEIASGEQTSSAVRELVADLWTCPMFGSGWKVAIVNEADYITPGAAVVWLDVLEKLPPRVVVVFTTNDVGKIPTRLRDRCEVVSFQSSYMLLKETADAFITEIWQKETGGAETPRLDDLAGVIEDGEVSFRRLLQKLQPYVRAGKAPESVAPAVAAAKRAWETRRKNGGKS